MVKPYDTWMKNGSSPQAVSPSGPWKHTNKIKESKSALGKLSQTMSGITTLPILAGIKQCKCMVNLRDFPIKVQCLSW